MIGLKSIQKLHFLCNILLINLMTFLDFPTLLHGLKLLLTSQQLLLLPLKTDSQLLFFGVQLMFELDDINHKEKDALIFDDLGSNFPSPLDVFFLQTLQKVQG